MRILILNGPNLDLLGTREPHIYGSVSFDEHFATMRALFPDQELRYAQSNVEGELVELLRKSVSEVDAVVFNPAGYSHTSVALRDTITVIGRPVVEVHISNIHGREEFRHRSVTGGACVGVITGFGLEGYNMAVRHLVQRGVSKADRSS
ncbi:MAG TPA: type II 3-dehydroquinate dehydratase [Flavobacteriales bacterium]|nr:type II 3-dehydroquinate dehydratase [Flavobacteriales bacterium]